MHLVELVKKRKHVGITHMFTSRVQGAKVGAGLRTCQPSSSWRHRAWGEHGLKKHPVPSMLPHASKGSGGRSACVHATGTSRHLRAGCMHTKGSTCAATRMRCSISYMQHPAAQHQLQVPHLLPTSHDLTSQVIVYLLGAYAKYGWPHAWVSGTSACTPLLRAHGTHHMHACVAHTVPQAYGIMHPACPPPHAGPWP